MNEQLKYRTIQCFTCERKGCENKSVVRLNYEHGDIHVCEDCLKYIWKKTRWYKSIHKACKKMTKVLASPKKKT